MVAMRTMGTMRMFMAVIVVMCPPQDERTHDVDGQAQHAHHHRLLVLNRLG